MTRTRYESTLRAAFIGALIALGSWNLSASSASAQPTWSNHAGNPQHTGLSNVPSQALEQIIWSTSVDLSPSSIIHYGTPLVTDSNVVIVPVKVGSSDGFRVEAHDGLTGGLNWQIASDYSLPTHNWIPSYGPALTPSGRLYMAAAGGTVFAVDGVNGLAPTTTRIAFYGIANYNANPSGFANDVKICTPLTADAAGNVYFGYRASGSNPLGLTGGVARIAPDGSGSFTTTQAIVGIAGSVVLLNCAPAVSNDGLSIYTAIRRPSGGTGFLVKLDAMTLARQDSAQVMDPKSGRPAALPNDGSTTPMVAPDDRVYFGVLEVPGFSNDDRGWMLQFTPNLVRSGPAGAFGWDNTPALVPAGMVPSYAGTSSYLLMTKYNNYAGAGANGDGNNRIAILDPNATEIETYCDTTAMKEVLTIRGVTPDSSVIDSYPNAVREWCINTAAVDPYTHSVMANSEDGTLYRWNLDSNTFTQRMRLTDGVGEAYTPTFIGTNGFVYAINAGVLFAVGNPNATAVTATTAATPRLALEVVRNPLREGTTLRYVLPHAGRVTLAILDAQGRRMANLVHGDLGPGMRIAAWDGRDGSGARVPAGVYFARLALGADSAVQRLVVIR